MANTLTVRIKELYNCKLGTFNGMLNIYIVNSDGTRTQIGARGVQIEHPYFYPIDVSCSVPEDTPLGNYTLEVEAEDLETGAGSIVYIGEDHPITITDENVDFKPNVQVTKMEFVKSLMNDSTICVEIKNFINLDPQPFKGDVALTLATESNKELCKLGTPVKVKKALDMYYFNATMDYLIGVVPDSIPDGVYHVTAMARQEGFEGWEWVKKYEVQDNTIVGYNKELYLTIQIEEGKIKTDNIVVPEKYFSDIETTGMTLNEEKCKGRTVSITIDNFANLGDETFQGSLPEPV